MATSKLLVESKTQLQFTLELEEAAWLHSVMQNPLHGENPENEDPHSRAIRAKLFDLTRTAEEELYTRKSAVMRDLAKRLDTPVIDVPLAKPVLPGELDGVPTAPKNQPTNES